MNKQSFEYNEKCSLKENLYTDIEVCNYGQVVQETTEIDNIHIALTLKMI